MTVNPLKTLIERRQVAEVEYYKIQQSVEPYYKVYDEARDAVINEFINQKLYISIDELPNYLQGKDISNIEVVYKDGSTDELYHEYDISYLTEKWNHKQDKFVPARLLSSGVSDDGYFFEKDIDQSGIVGFFNLKLANGTQVKETYMEDIIKNILAN